MYQIAQCDKVLGILTSMVETKGMRLLTESKFTQKAFYTNEPFPKKLMKPEKHSMHTSGRSSNGTLAQRPDVPSGWSSQTTSILTRGKRSEGMRTSSVSDISKTNGSAVGTRPTLGYRRLTPMIQFMSLKTGGSTGVHEVKELASGTSILTMRCSVRRFPMKVFHPVAIGSC